MIVTHNIKDISFDKSFIYLMMDGKQVKVPLDKASSKLKNADEVQRNFYKISPSGYGIHWPLLDEDLSVEALVKLAEH